MNKLNNYILKYLLFSCPAVFAIITWGSFQSQQEIFNNSNRLIYGIWNILSWHLIFWFIILIYSLFAILVSPAFRNQILLKLGRIKDRDEREGYIIAQSSRFTFFSTFSLLLFLLFISTVNISISKLSKEKKFNGKKHELSIGISYKIFKENNKEVEDKDIIFSTKSIPLTCQNILILIIIWHLGTYYYSSKTMQIEK